MSSMSIQKLQITGGDIDIRLLMKYAQLCVILGKIDQKTNNEVVFLLSCKIGFSDIQGFISRPTLCALHSSTYSEARYII
jgi:hypothetical protein